jgi:hypothetical protein
MLPDRVQYCTQAAMRRADTTDGQHPMVVAGKRAAVLTCMVAM